jgi:hypothetical protein
MVFVAIVVMAGMVAVLLVVIFVVVGVAFVTLFLLAVAFRRMVLVVPMVAVVMAGMVVAMVRLFGGEGLP